MSMTSAWAALYFIALMTFGNYVLFNLLVAILVEGFSAEVCLLSTSRHKSKKTWSTQNILQGEERMREDAMIKAALNDMKRKKSIALDVKSNKMSQGMTKHSKLGSA